MVTKSYVQSLMAAITFMSSRLHWQIPTCMTKAPLCFHHLERETAVRESTMTGPGSHIKSVMVQVVEPGWPGSGIISPGRNILTKVDAIFSLSFSDFSWIPPGSGLVTKKTEWGLRCIKPRFVIPGGCFDFSQLSVAGDVSVRCCARCFPQTVT